MALIQNVNYLEMPVHADSMRGYGRELNNEMLKVYETVKEMHEYWYGERYNELVKAFNKMIPNLKEVLKLVVTDFPITLETVANNYSQVDRGVPVVTVKNELPKDIEELALFNDTSMRFTTATVIDERQKIQAGFIKAKELMNEIELAYKLIQWESLAADAFKVKFTKLKNDITTSLDNINTQFAKLMEQTQLDMDNAENANTVN